MFRDETNTWKKVLCALAREPQGQFFYSILCEYNVLLSQLFNKGVDSSSLDLLLEAKFVASAMFSGKACPKVSGKKKWTRDPLTNANEPKMAMGSQGWELKASPAM